MKRKLLFALSALLCAATLLSGCKDPGAEGEGEKPPVVEPVLTVDETPIQAGAEGMTGRIDVEANGKWTAVIEPETVSWMTLTGSTGDGDGAVSFKINKNGIATARTAEVVFTMGELEKRVPVEQAAADGEFSISTDRIAAEAAGGQFTILVSANLAWQAEVKDASSNGWVSLTDSEGEGDGTIKVNVEENTTLYTKSATVLVYPAGQASEAYEVAVVQAGVPVTLTIDPTEIRDISGTEGATHTINVTSNSAWSIDGNAWITVTGGSGTGDGSFEIAVAPNTESQNPREVTLKVITPDGTEARLFVHQFEGYIPPEVRFSSSADIEMEAEGGEATVNVIANVDWTVTPADSWVTTDPASGANNYDGLKIVVESNTTTEPRQTTVTVAGEGASHSITVKQAAGDGEAGLKIGNLIWATRNVGEKGKFASGGIGDKGMFYQFNRNVAWPATGSADSWNTETPTTGGWSVENSPCPTGWRIPTKADFTALASAAKRRAAGEGFWFRESPAFTTPFPSISNPQDAMVLPYTGLRNRLTGGIGSTTTGYYWTSEVDSSDVPIIVKFGSTFTTSVIISMTEEIDGNKNSGMMIRCVKDAD